VGLAVLNSNVDKLSIFGLLGSREDEGGVGGGILWLIFADGCGVSVIYPRIEEGGELDSRRVEWGCFAGGVTYRQNHL
jgi:hypothetical protein